MSENLPIISARIDDIPLLLAQLEGRGVQSWLDEHFPTHGNWTGLSLGWVGVLGLTHIVSQADPRLNHVESWAEQRLHPLRGCTGQLLPPLDGSDDRLAGRLKALSDDERWGTFEGALNQPLLRVDDLQPQRVRLDSPPASGSWGVSEDGLCQLGHRKEHRPDLPQVKGMLAALAPLGMAVATDVGPGQRADDPRDVPAITRGRASLARRGLLDVGDCKRGALETRALLQAGGDDSLCPLSALHVPPEGWEEYVAPSGQGSRP